MKNKENILVITREPEWQAFVARVLRAEGYTVNLSHERQSALWKIAAQDFDLIIIDAALLDLLEDLARKHIHNRLLVVTTTPSVAEAIVAYRYGALDYEGKTFDASKLLTLVARTLQKQPARQFLLV